MSNKMYKSIRRWGLVALVGVAVLTSCTPEEQDTNSGGFFKISVAAEEFRAAGIDTRSQVTAQCDTVITPIEDNLYMETVLIRDSTTTANTRAALRKPIAQGTVLTVLVYKSDDTYIDKFTATVETNGSVNTDTKIYLAPGKYKFVCLVETYILEGNTQIRANPTRNNMAVMIERTIRPEDSDCKLDFILKHLMGQISIQVKSEGAGKFVGMSANLSATSKETYILFNLPNLEGVSREVADIKNTSFFSNVTGFDFTSTGVIIKYYNKRNFMPNSVILQFRGTINGVSLDGKEVVLKNLEVNMNEISKVVVTFKQKPVPPAIDSTPSEDWGDIPLTPGNDIELTL